MSDFYKAKSYIVKKGTVGYGTTTSFILTKRGSAFLFQTVLL